MTFGASKNNTSFKLIHVASIFNEVLIQKSDGVLIFRFFSNHHPSPEMSSDRHSKIGRTHELGIPVEYLTCDIHLHVSLSIY